ncbi:hypothetical protein [Rubrobacter indicoceani]|uniref:hypothetical protein n=1 Tax=Rubrobacter indicoceani TaxID=2051957 RepID=UPI000E5C464C|nr:hypothetical protein [Rubrobacter indicoceani]
MIGHTDPGEQADRDFTRARRRAFLRKVGSFLKNEPASNTLLSFEEVKSALGAVEQVYLGMRTVEVSKIVGSVGRHRDFDRAFLPSKRELGERWKRINRLMQSSEGVPPVSLFKIGDAYFVRDGNHRVSVARQQKIEMIDAEVIMLKTRVPIDSHLTAEELLHKMELRLLLERLPFDRVLPEVEVRLSDVSEYRSLATLIEGHGFRLSQLWHRFVSSEEVLRDWYEYSFRPVSEMIREEKVLLFFPKRTELDLYLWVVRNRDRLALEARSNRVTQADAMDDILRKRHRRVQLPGTET